MLVGGISHLNCHAPSLSDDIQQDPLSLGDLVVMKHILNLVIVVSSLKNTKFGNRKKAIHIRNNRIHLGVENYTEEGL